MDNEFVPNKSFMNLEFLDYLIDKGCNISVHLMVADVEKFVKQIVTKKVKYITFHCEAEKIEKSIEIIKYIRSKGIKGGIAIKPSTNLNDYKELIKMSDKITIMSVEPGFGGQKYIDGSEIRVNKIRELCYNDTILEIDGGINDKTMLLCKNNINHFVTGSFLFNNIEKFEELKKILN